MKNGAMGVKFCVMIVHYCVIKLLVINAIHSTFESLKQKLKTMKQKLFFVVFMMLGIGLNAYSSITSFNCYDGGRKLVEVVLNSPCSDDTGYLLLSGPLSGCADDSA